MLSDTPTPEGLLSAAKEVLNDAYSPALSTYERATVPDSLAKEGVVPFSITRPEPDAVVPDASPDLAALACALACFRVWRKP